MESTGTVLCLQDGKQQSNAPQLVASARELPGLGIARRANMDVAVVTLKDDALDNMLHVANNFARRR